MPLDVDAYLRHLECPRPAGPDLATLRALHLEHQHRVPFENLDVVRGIPLSLDIDRLQEKVLVRGRGGFCYELNTLFAALLRALGYEVALLSAGVTSAAGVHGPMFDHLTLEVRTTDSEQPWLCDVGFGRSFLEPLPLGPSEDLRDRGGRFALRCKEVTMGETEPIFASSAADGFGADGAIWTLLRHDPAEPRAAEDGWVELYRFDRVPRRIDDFHQMLHFHQVSADSHFPSTWICTRAEPGGRCTVRDLEVIETSAEGTRRWTLEDAAARRVLLRARFGIDLDGPEDP